MDYYEIANALAPVWGEFKEAMEHLPEVEESILNNAIIAGGCIHSMRICREPKDYDYFLIGPDLCRRVEAYLDELGVAVGANIVRGEFKLSRTAFSLSIQGKYLHQLVLKYSGLSGHAIVNQFDFKHNMVYCMPESLPYSFSIVHTVPDKYINSIRLRFNQTRARDLSGVMMRVPKFVARGYTITGTEMKKLIKRILKLDKDGNEYELSYLRSYCGFTY